VPDVGGGKAIAKRNAVSTNTNKLPNSQITKSTN